MTSTRGKFSIICDIRQVQNTEDISTKNYRNKIRAICSTRPKPSDFQGEKILSSPSFGGDVKPSVPCRRSAACKRSQNLRGSRNLGKITGNFLAHSSTYRCYDLSRRCGRTGTWRRKWERLKVGESNGKLPPRTCPGCSVPEPHRSHDWALVPANPASKAEY